MKYAIIGYGLEGKSAEKYFRRQPDAEEIKIFSSDSAQSFTDQLPRDLSGWTLVRSPGVAPRKLPAGARTITLTREFFAKCPCPIIGVTGTKGKGTTTSLTAAILAEVFKTSKFYHPEFSPGSSENSAQILKRVQDDNKSEYLDRSVWTVGNIGLPALDVLDKIRPDDAVCYEMSSFQLWDLKKSPHIAVLTIIEPDHLNVHKDFAEYVAAKTNIVKFQTAGDFVIYNADDAEIRRMAAQSKGCKVAYSAKVMPDLIKQNLRLPGAHNQMDALAATLAATAFCRPELFKNNADAAEILKQVQADGELIAAIARALQNFHGLPHRLQFAGEKRGVKYFDDSFATAPGAAITALKAFPGAVKSIILGGSDKGADFTELAKAVSKAKMRKVYLIGQIGRKIGAAITKFAPDVNAEYLPEKNLAKIVQQIAGESQPGDVVILSPAAASFDMFKNYYDRGEQFLAAVKALPE